MWWRRSVRRPASALRAGLPPAREALDAERRQTLAPRETGATSASVLDAIDLADEALRLATHHDDVALALAVRRLVAATDDWTEAAVATVAVRALGPAAEEVLARRADDPRLAPPPPPPPPHPWDPRLEPVPARTSEFLLPDATQMPEVLDALRSGDAIGALKAYRARTGTSLADAQGAVDWAARRLGLPETRKPS